MRDINMEILRRNAVPCDHSRFGCQNCRNERAAATQERPRAPVMLATKATQDLLQQMLEEANQRTRDLSAVVGRIEAENKMLREQLAELRADQKKRRKK